MGDSQRPQPPLQHPPEVKGRVLRSSTGFKSWFSSCGSSHNGSKNAQGAYAGPVDGEAGSHRSQTWSEPGKSDQEEGAMSVPSYNLSEEALRCFLQKKWPRRGFTIVHVSPAPQPYYSRF